MLVVLSGKNKKIGFYFSDKRSFRQRIGKKYKNIGMGVRKL
jgi:hypothetical protein